MHIERVGGVLFIAGSLLLIVVGGIAATGGSVGLGVRDAGGVTLAAALAFLGTGAAAISIGGRDPFADRSVRAGLGILGGGLIATTASAALAATSAFDPMESIPGVLLFLLGGLAWFVGAGVTMLALVRQPGARRTIASVFVAGLVLAAIAGAVSSNGVVDGPLGVAAFALAATGGCAVLGAMVGIGALALRGERPRLAREAVTGP